MKSGVALDDQDRKPWLKSLSAELAVWERERGAVLACSALKESYRQVLSSQCKTNIIWIFLSGSRMLLTERLDSRAGHFFNPKLLDSQLATLELPEYGWVIDVQSTPEEIISDISQRLTEIRNASASDNL
jgi:6-phosphogluconate dehydrogenase/gluconokinase